MNYYSDKLLFDLDSDMLYNQQDQRYTVYTSSMLVSSISEETSKFPELNSLNVLPHTANRKSSVIFAFWKIIRKVTVRKVSYTYYSHLRGNNRSSVKSQLSLSRLPHSALSQFERTGGPCHR